MANLGEYIVQNQQMRPGDYLVSNNGLFFAWLKPNGNFVVGRGDPNTIQGVTFGSGTTSTDQLTIIMQGDGNLVIYYLDKPYVSQNALWSTQTSRMPFANYFLIMQNDGNLVIYQGSPTISGAHPIWGSNTVDPVKSFEVNSIQFGSNVNYLGNEGVISRQSLFSYYNKENITASMPVDNSTSTTMSGQWSANDGSIKVKISNTFVFTVLNLSVGNPNIMIQAHYPNGFRFGAYFSANVAFSGAGCISVGPNSKLKGDLTVSFKKISVPFIAAGFYTLVSGNKIASTLSGVYNGSAITDINIAWKSSPL